MSAGSVVDPRATRTSPQASDPWRCDVWRWCAAILAAWSLAALITPPAVLIAAGGDLSAIGLLMFILVMPAWSFGLVVILLVTYAAYVGRALYARSREEPVGPVDDER